MTHGFFKGLLFLGLGLGHPRRPRGAGHAPDGRPVARRSRSPTRRCSSARSRSPGSRRWPASSRKDEILGEAFKFGFYWVWAIGLFVALLTAFYMFRLMGLTFWGAFRGPKAVWDRIHESPAVMTVPLILLAIPSVLLGMALGLPLGDSTLHHWLEPVFHHATEELLHLPHEPYALFGIDGGLILASVTVAAIGVALRLAVLRRRHRRDPRCRRGPSGCARSARSPGCRSCTAPRSTSGGSTSSTTCCSSSSAVGSRAAMWWFDREVVDGTVNGVGRSTVVRRARACATSRPGRVQNYALGIAVGLIVMAGSYLILAGSDA